VNPADYDILLISRGKEPEKVNLGKNTLEITRYLFKENKLVTFNLS
jgi:protease I